MSEDNQKDDNEKIVAPQVSPEATPSTQETSTQETTEAKEATEATEATKQKKKKEDTVETYWSDHVKKMPWGLFYEDGKNHVFYKWTGKYWTPMGVNDIANAAEEFLFQHFKHRYTNSTKKSCVELTDSILARSGKILEKVENRDIFSVRGGYLEILVDGSVKWSPHNKGLFIRQYIDVPIYKNMCDDQGFYNPTNQEEIEGRGLLGRLITNSFEELEIRRALQEHLGDTLLHTNRQRTPFLIGSGGQGKSQWIVLMKGMHTNHAVADLSNLKGFNMASFIGCSLLVVDEAEKRIDEQAFKRIFGGGAGVQVDRKYKESLSWTPDIKGLVGLNEMPVFSEHSEAILRRIDPYPMTKAMHKSKQNVPDIAKKILDGYKKAGEGRGVEIFVPDQKRDFFDWLLQGAIRVTKRGGLIPEDEMPKACRIEKEVLRGETEPVYAFIQDLEWVPVDGKGGITKHEIYNVYVAWCKENGRTGIMSTHRFGKDLKRNVEKLYGQGSLKESKMSVIVNTPHQKKTGEDFYEERAQKTCYRLIAKNAPEYDIQYGNYVWDDQAPDFFNVLTGHKTWCDKTCGDHCKDFDCLEELKNARIDDSVKF